MKNLLKLENIHEEFRTIDTDISLNSIMIFSIIGRFFEKFKKTKNNDDLCCNQDLVKILNLTRASVSRNVATLSKRSKRKFAFKLINKERNPSAPYRNILTLTEKGEVLFNQIKHILSENYVPYDLTHNYSKNYDKRTGFNSRTGERVTKKSKILNQIKKLEKQLQEMA